MFTIRVRKVEKKYCFFLSERAIVYEAAELRVVFLYEMGVFILFVTEDVARSNNYLM